MKHKIVLDTNVLVTALLSRNGASFKLLSLIDDKKIELVLSAPLVKEYEDVLSREKFAFNNDSIKDILDYLCLISSHHKIYYLWRPILKDFKDDMVLELAVKANAIIVTHNKKDFEGASKFNLPVLSASEFLHLLGEI
ncbi:MAG: putative toxin-antitoxin system toxin component, PIN family [Campylobacterota bacterium]|nr:putative toxin-antitoxin system toxin component, PIN family [Campylobacterota bacterium]